MADENRRMNDYTASDINDNIAEVRTARGTYDTLDDRLDDMEGFTPTEQQLAAMNSGITAEIVAADQAALTELVDGGAKNLYHFERIDRTSSGTATTTYTDTTSGNNITYTLNSDYSITVNGTTSSTGDGSYVNMFIGSSWIHLEDFCDDEHYLSGAPTGMLLRARANSLTDYQVDQSGDAALLTSGFTGTIFLQLIVAKGKTIDNLVCKPMICSKAAWDISQTYQPYRPSYQELYERVRALEGGT